MIVIHMERGTGKTHKAIQIAKNSNALLVVLTDDQAYHIRKTEGLECISHRQYHGMIDEENRNWKYEEKRRFVRSGQPIVIDEFDQYIATAFLHFLRYHFGGLNISVVTLSLSIGKTLANSFRVFLSENSERVYKNASGSTIMKERSPFDIFEYCFGKRRG